MIDSTCDSSNFCHLISEISLVTNLVTGFLNFVAFYCCFCLNLNPVICSVLGLNEKSLLKKEAFL
jgi:hypothetical protein